MDSGGSLNQPYIFLGALYIGVVMGIFYIFLRFTLKHLAKNKIFGWVSDILFFTAAGFFAVFSLNRLNHLELKLYVFGGILAGFFTVTLKSFIKDK